MKAYIRAVAAYEPGPFDGAVTLIWTEEMKLRKSGDLTRGWGELVSGTKIRERSQRSPGMRRFYLDQTAAAFNRYPICWGCSVFGRQSHPYDQF